MPTRITIAQLEQAINRARDAHPASGREFALATEVSLLGTLYGALIFRGQAYVDLDDLPEPQRSALSRWLPPAG
jgi:hypothetical protein